jgi:Na+-driven multidrug efflux pump
MSDFLGKVPVIGFIYDDLTNAPIKKKLKNSLKRKGVSGAALATLLSAGAGAVAVAGSLALLNEFGGDIDRWIDSLDDTTADIIWRLVLPGI